MKRFSRIGFGICPKSTNRSFLETDMEPATKGCWRCLSSCHHGCAEPALEKGPTAAVLAALLMRHGASIVHARIARSIAKYVIPSHSSSLSRRVQGKDAGMPEPRRA